MRAYSTSKCKNYFFSSKFLCFGLYIPHKNEVVNPEWFLNSCFICIVFIIVFFFHFVFAGFRLVVFFCIHFGFMHKKFKFLENNKNTCAMIIACERYGYDSNYSISTTFSLKLLE